MAKRMEIYKCEICGNIVEILHGGKGQLVCCEQLMSLLEPKTEDPEIGEKHVPVIEKTDSGVRVKVGSVTHPMEEKHYIEWIQVVCSDCGRTARKFLNPGDAPEATFEACVGCVTPLHAREYCNIHGLWKGEQ